MAKKNLSNDNVLQELMIHFEWKNKSQTEVEEDLGGGQTFTYEINFLIIEEVNGTFTMIGEVESDDGFMSFPIGKKYTKRGARIKAEQLMKLVSGSFKLEQAVGKKNKLKTWGYTYTKSSELLEIEESEMEKY
jgi:hypothetical protein